MEAVLRLRDELSAPLKAATGKMTEMQSVLSTVGKTLGITFGATAVIEFTKEVFRSADSLVRLHDVTAISLQGLQRLQIVGDEAGNSLEELTGAVSMMQRRLAGDDKSAVAALEKLGYSFEQLRTIAPDEQFMAIAEEIRKIQDPADQARIAVDLFGRSGAFVLPSIKRGFDDVRDSAVGMSDEAVHALDVTGDALARLWRSFKGGVGEAIGSWIHDLGQKWAQDRANWPVIDILASGVGELKMPHISPMKLPTNAGPIKGMGPAEVAGTLQDMDENLRKATEAAQRAAKPFQDISKEMREATFMGGNLSQMMKQLAETRLPMLESRVVAFGSTVLNLGVVSGDSYFHLAAMSTTIPTLASETFKATEAFTGLHGAVLRTNQTFDKSRPLVDDLKKDFQAIPGMIASAFTGGGGFLGAVKGIGTMLSSSLGKHLGEGMAALGQMGGPIGAAIGALAGPLIQMFGKMFDHAAKDFRKMGNQLGVELSSGMVDQLKTDSKKFGGEVQAMLMNLDKIVGEAGGVAAFGVEKAIGKTRDLFSMLETKKLTVTQVGQEFDKMFGLILPEAVSKFTGLATSGFLDLIDMAHKFGVESKTLTDFIAGQSSQVSSGLNAIASGTVGAFNAAGKSIHETGTALVTAREKVETLKAKISDLTARISDQQAKGGPITASQIAEMDVWKRQLSDAQMEVTSLSDKQQAAMQTMTDATQGGQEAFDRLGRLATVAFGAALGSGKTFLEAITSIGPTLDTLTEAQGTFGFTSSGTFTELMKFRQFAENNKELIGTLDGVNSMMSGLHNLGALTQDTFSDLTAISTDTFKKMTGGGLSGEQAMRAMQPTLQRIWELQENFGYTIDDSTQALLHQAETAGIVGKDHEDAMTRAAKAMDHVADTLDRMAKKMGVELPDAARAGASGIQTALDEIHTPEIPAPWADWGMPPGIPDLASQGEAAGGIIHAAMGARILPFARGTDTVPAMLTPGERVLSVDQNRAFERGAGMIDLSSVIRELRDLKSEMRWQRRTIPSAIRDALQRNRAS